MPGSLFGLTADGDQRSAQRQLHHDIDRLSMTGRPAAIHWVLIALQPWPESIAPWRKAG